MEKTENSKSNNSRRRLSIVAVLVLVVAVICGGGLWWHRTAVQEHNRAFASYRAAAKTYKVQESEYHRYLASDEVKAASTVTDDQVIDAKTVHALAKGVQVVKPTSGRTTGAKTNLTGDASTSELKTAADTLNAQTSKLKSKLKALKGDVLAVTTSQAQKLLSDAIGNGDKILVDSDGKVPDGDQTRNNLTKALESAKDVLNDKQSVLKVFSDAKADLDAKVKAVNDAVSAKAQADQDAARQRDEQARSAQAQAGSARAPGASSSGLYPQSRWSGSMSGNFQNQPGAGRQGSTGNGGGSTSPQVPAVNPAPTTPQYTQEQIDGAHRYLCIMQPDITTGC
ncbi:hypothetical protein H3S93_07005 [Bifidobacterium sp. W8109]|uniref:hypothetical protein n=1 Tax=Bifidobacterium TaxID=1678 RepID=UPI0018DBD161|nr:MULTISPECIES: hypothetical protein [Bifidobacterium]MBH9972053.1 hypothetical protein [Bifidobacterium asteroides]MBI0073776.1 hypothetical protein [Bifidobacterium sp. W8110]